MDSPIKYHHPSLVVASLTLSEAEFLIPAKRRGKKGAQYNPRNAMKFRPYFDRILAKPDEALLIPAEINGVMPSTLHVQVNEALKWLVDQPAKDFDKYRVLRYSITNRRTADGIILQIKQGFKAVEPVKANLTNSSGLRKGDWKARFLDFIETASIRPAQLTIDDVVLTDDDLTFINQVTSQIEGTAVVYQGKELYVTLS